MDQALDARRSAAFFEDYFIVSRYALQLADEAIEAVEAIDSSLARRETNNMAASPSAQSAASRLSAWARAATASDAAAAVSTWRRSFPCPEYKLERVENR
jgi:hypothetical protein